MAERTAIGDPAGGRLRRPRQVSLTVIASLSLVAGLSFLTGLTGCSGREPEAGSRRPDIVLVVLDTVRDDFTGPGGAGPGSTDAFDRLARDSVRFENAWSNAPWTVPSHASIFTGRLPSAHGCTSLSPRFEVEAPVLAERLAEAGYRTAAFFSNPWLADRTSGLLRGFGHRSESQVAGFGDSAATVPGDQGGRAIAAALDGWLAAQSTVAPLFVYVNFLEAHLPYDPPREYRDRQLADLPAEAAVSVELALEFNAGLHPEETVDWATVRRLYGGDVHTADAWLGALVATLRRSGRLEDAVLIVTSDHGENLGDHGLMEHQFSVHETLLDVPLILHAPGRLAPASRGDPAMLLDLYATILELAGAPPDPDAPLSRSLLAALLPSDRPTFAEYAGGAPSLVELLRSLNPELQADRTRGFRSVRVGDLRLTVGTDERATLHDLSTDPAQSRDLAQAARPDVDRLRVLLERWSDAAALRAGGSSEIDEETLETLRSLGYVQ